LKSLADTGLGAASVLVNLHHRRIYPLMERELSIIEMGETANPVSLARSRLVHDRFPLEYTSTSARRAINLKAVRNSNDDLWSFVMLPDAPLVSGLSPFSFIHSQCIGVALTFHSSQQRVAVNATRSDPPTPRAQARAPQQREQERAARKKEQRNRQWEHWEQRDEQFRLREQQGLYPPATSEYSSSGEEEEEENDGGQAPLRGGSLRPPHREPWRRQRSKHLGRSRKRPPPGSLRKGRHASRKR
jgi:hypothetical protein